MNTDFYQFYLNTKILFQPGISKDFSNELSQLGITKLCIIADPFLAANGTVVEIIRGIEAAGGEVVAEYHDVPPNSELAVVQACAALARTKGAEGIVAIGGGSALDTAKAANIIFSLGGDLVEDYSGTQTITQNLKPLIAIPTTAGTGSEVTSAAVILDAENHVKLAFSDSYLRPTLALLDPELTLTMPPKITAMTAMDALTHAVEAMHSVQANPMSDALAAKAITLINDNLCAVVEDGANLELRSKMLIAANMAGIAFDHAMVAIVHAMAHAAGGVAHVPHGLANSIFLPYGMEYNLSSSALPYARVAHYLGASSKENSAEENALAAVKHIKDLQQKLKGLCGLPTRLRDASVEEGQLKAIAEAAVEDGASFYNPREVTFEEVYKKIKEAY